MKPSEFRLGNLITSDGEIFTVDEIHADYVNAGALGIYPAGFHDDYGIPLTEEWLLKFGFVQQGNRKMWTKDKCAVLWHEGNPPFHEEGMYIAFKDMGNVIYHTQCRVRYVHQLQNTYFVTGEELTIKE